MRGEARARRAGRWARQVAVVLAALVGFTLVEIVVAPTAGAATPIRCGVTTLPMGTGRGQSFAMGSDGSVWAAGSNEQGQLGDGTRIDRPRPVRIAGLTDVVSVSVGFGFAMALTVDGSLWAWGVNDHGQLGIGSTVTQIRPVKVNIDSVSQVSTGGGHVLALKTDGTLWVWGQGEQGRLGLGDVTDRAVPTQLAGLPPIAQVSAGKAANSAVLLVDGRIATWGRGNEGQLGYGGLFLPEQTTPEIVPGLNGVTQVSVGGSHMLALRSDGSAWAWGQNISGELGDGTSGSVSYRGTPGRVPNLPAVQAVSAGYSFSMAATTSGAGRAWGSNFIGQLGDGTQVNRNLPVAISGLSGIKAVSAGINDASALTGDGRMHFWGENVGGSTGSGDVSDVRRTPFAWTAARQSAPSTPTELTVTAGEKLAHLVWKRSPEVVTQYDVTTTRNGTVVGSTPVNPPVARSTRRNLDSGAQYTFTVVAQNCLGSSTATAASEPVVPQEPVAAGSSSVESERLTDRLDVAVDTRSGDLSVRSADLRIAGIGADLQIGRTHHSKAGPQDRGWFGRSWSSNTGRDVGVREIVVSPTITSVEYRGPGGTVAHFVRQTNGTYAPPRGLDAELVKNPDGTFTLIDDADGMRHEFDAAGRLAARGDRYGNRVTMRYDPTSGLLSSIVDSRNRTLTITHNTRGDVSRIVDPTGRTWQYQYDANANLTLYIDPAGGRTQFDYDATRLITRIITPAGRQVRFGYDATRRVTSITYPLAPGGPVTAFTYQPDTDTGSGTVVTDANGAKTTYGFDPAGRTLTVTDGLGNATSATYTSRSNVSSVTVGASRTSLGYDSARNLVSTSTADGVEQRADFADPAHPHLPTTLVDTQGNQTSYQYDESGSVVKATNQLPTGNQVVMTYRPDGQPETSRTPNGPLTRYIYDGVGQLTAISAPDAHTTRMEHDALSRLVRLSEVASAVRTLTYDPLDRVTSTTYPDGSVTRSVYDGDGNLVESVDADGSTIMTYDQRNRLVQRAEPSGRSVIYTYDRVGNLVGMNDGGGPVTYVYNAANLLSELKEPGGATTRFGHDAAYNRTVVAYPNGISLNRTYDSSNRLATISAVQATRTLFQKTYGYTAPSGSFPNSGLRHTVTELDGTTTLHSYDAMNRLIRARTQRPGDGALIIAYEYSYDGNGNRLTEFIDRPVGDTRAAYSYNNYDQLVDRQGEPFSYDKTGNLTGQDAGTEDATAFTYNAADQTTSIATPGDPTPAARFRYRGDGQGERILGGPNLEISYGNTMLGVSSQRSPAGEQFFTRDPSGGLIGQRGSGGTQYFLTDGLGSVVGVTGADGSMTATYVYNPFGRPVDWAGNIGITPWRFAGQYLDERTGLYKMGERYYDPGTGRWTQPDPYLSSPLDPLNANRYLYVGSDPVNHTDPSGLMTDCQKVAAVAAGALLIGAGIAVVGTFFGVEGAVIASAAMLRITVRMAPQVIKRRGEIMRFISAAWTFVSEATAGVVGIVRRCFG